MIATTTKRKRGQQGLGSGGKFGRSVVRNRGKVSEKRPGYKIWDKEVRRENSMPRHPAKRPLCRNRTSPHHITSKARITQKMSQEAVDLPRNAHECWKFVDPSVPCR